MLVKIYKCINSCVLCPKQVFFSIYVVGSKQNYIYIFFKSKKASKFMLAMLN